MDVLRGCGAACVQCQGGEVTQETRCKPKLCAWSEEEVDGLDGGVGMDYGFLGKRPMTGGDEDGLPLRSSASDRLPLFEPGSLVPLRGSAKDRAVSGRYPRQLAEAYALDDAPFGRGSYGEVIGATHRRTRARRAVKTVGKAGLKRYVKDVSSFVRREVDILRRLDHPHIVRMYEALEDESTIYIVLEICEGGDLLERVTVARDRLSESASSALLVQMLSAVQHLYLRGVVHRDIKPENFLFLRRETDAEPRPPLKLIDFGLSRRLDFASGARVTPKIGTTEYMAPEAFAGRARPALADRMDVWSLGVVLHVIFIGHFPSPRLAELTTEEYLALPCWRRVSPLARDFLGQLIRYEAEKRPTVTAALKHPWLAAAAAASGESARWAKGVLPKAIRAHARSSDLRKLALVAAAREVDECNLRELREVFRELDIACEGSLTRMALARIASAPQAHLSGAAAELLRCFDDLDVDGSGSVDWSELVAGVVGASFSKLFGRGASPAFDEAICFRAFDLLGQGTEAVSGHTLSKLFLASDSEANVDTPSGGTGGSLDGGGAARHRAADLTRMCKEADASGMINRNRFLALMQGR